MAKGARHLTKIATGLSVNLSDKTRARATKRSPELPLTILHLCYVLSRLWDPSGFTTYIGFAARTAVVFSFCFGFWCDFLPPKPLSPACVTYIMQQRNGI